MADGTSSEFVASEWAERSDYWLKSVINTKPKRSRREREPQPLILTGHGLSLCVEQGRLVIRDGNTHYPAERREYRYFKGSLDLPPRIVVLDGHGSLTLDALDWLAEQNVPLIRVRWNGSFLSLVTSGGQSADPKKYAWQLEARQDDAKRLSFALPIIREKLQNALVTLQSHLPQSRDREMAEQKTSGFLDSLKSAPPKSLKDLLAIEAQAASAYFRAWRHIDLKWKSMSRYPIPDDWREYLSRSSLYGGSKMENVFATHPVNAMLNYAYTVLLGQMQLKAIVDGYDPMVGIIHTRKRSRFGPMRPSFALDIMEPMRPVLDRAVLKLVREETFSGADFLLQSDGVCRLNWELARRVAQSSAVALRP